MANIVFGYRDPSNRVLQERRPGFLLNGDIQIDDGFVTTVLGDGTEHVTTYAVLRPFAFFDPGLPWRSSLITPGDESGILPVNFRRGRVFITRPLSRVIMLTSSKSHQFLKGRLTLTSASALGSLTDFAFWGAAQNDPQVTYIESATNSTSGHVTAAWVRNNVIFVPRRTTQYLGVGTKVFSLPNTGTARTQYFRKWMLEKAAPGGTYPTAAYGKAREVVVTVEPDRLNLFPNPSFEVDASGIVAVANATFARSTTKFYGVGVASLAITATAGGAASVRSIITSTPARAGKSYSVLAALAPGTTARYVEVWIEFYNSSSVLLLAGPKTTIKEIDATTWVLPKAENVTAPDTTAYVSVVVNVLAAGAAEVHYLDAVLLEPKDRVGTYFDGSTSADTIWEKGGTTGKTRSYLYKNRAERYAAIMRVLQENVPMGIGIATPVFGTLPVN